MQCSFYSRQALCITPILVFGAIVFPLISARAGPVGESGLTLEAHHPLPACDSKEVLQRALAHQLIIWHIKDEQCEKEVCLH